MSISPATQWFHHRAPFAMHRGGQLPGFTLAYETWGRLAPERDNVAVIFTGMSPSAHAASSEADPARGWWEPMIGPGKPIDTNCFFVVCMNSLGSCKGSTGPASINPETDKPWRLDFPELAIEDMAASAHLLLESLGISRVKVLIGPSMGGMTALAYLAQYPGAVEHMISISSAYRAEPWGIAMRSLQREMICSDPMWNHGTYTDEEWPRLGMRLARKLGMMTYRTSIEWERRFGREPQDRYEPRIWGMHFQIESYLEAAADRFVGQFDPNSYIYLSRAIDWFDATQGTGSLQHAMRDTALGSVLVIGIETDVLYPIRQQRAIADTFEDLGCKTTFVGMPSHHGHDAFLTDYEHFAPIMGDYLAGVLGNGNGDGDGEHAG